MTDNVKEFGPVRLAITSQFEFIYNDKRSGAKRDVGIWSPKAAQFGPEFRPLGHVAVNNYSDINGNTSALVVAPGQDSGGKPALADPMGYRRIYYDKRTGAKLYCAIWRPVAPVGYVALGDVAIGNWNDKPLLTAIWCVREDLAYKGDFAKPSIWNDRRSGGRYDVELWAVYGGQSMNFDQDVGHFPVNTFLAATKYDAPNPDPNVGFVPWVLSLPLPTVQVKDPEPPQMTGREKPSSATTPQMETQVFLPFTAIFGFNDKESLSMISKPFLSVERWAHYELLLFDNNSTSLPQHKQQDTTVGVSIGQSEEFSRKTGITISHEVGAEIVMIPDIFNFSSKTTFSISEEFGYVSQNSRDELFQRTISAHLDTPPNTSATLWQIIYAFRLYRADRTLVGELSFPVDAFSETQYPVIEEKYPKFVSFA